MIVLNTLSVLANVLLELYILHFPLWFHFNEWNNLVWQSHTCGCHIKQTNKNMQLQSQQNTINTDQNKPIISTLRTSGGGSVPGLSVPWCQSYPEASGGVWSPKKRKSDKSTTDEFHCVLIRKESKNNKGKLAKIRRKKNLCLFLKNLCRAWMWIPAWAKSWVQNQILQQRLSQPINIKAVQVRLDRSLHALVPQIDCRDTTSARVHFRFNNMCNTTQIRGTNLTHQLVNWY